MKVLLPTFLLAAWAINLSGAQSESRFVLASQLEKVPSTTRNGDDKGSMVRRMKDVSDFQGDGEYPRSLGPTDAAPGDESRPSPPLRASRDNLVVGGIAHRRDQLIVYPICNICGDDDQFLPEEIFLSELLFIPSLGFELTCENAYKAGLGGLVSPDFCTSMTSSIAATGVCGCASVYDGLEDLFAVQLNNRLFGNSPANEDGLPTFPLYTAVNPTELFEVGEVSILTLSGQLSTVSILDANLYSKEEIADALAAENEQSVQDLFLDMSFEANVVSAAFDPMDLETLFVGVAFRFLAMGEARAYLIILGSTADLDITATQEQEERARLLQALPVLPSLNCPSLFGEGINTAQASCPKFGDGIVVDKTCEEQFLSQGCPSKVSETEGEINVYRAALKVARAVFKDSIAALKLAKLGMYLGAVVLCSRGTVPIAIAVCLAAAIVKIERFGVIAKAAIKATRDDAIALAAKFLQDYAADIRNLCILRAQSCATCDADAGLQFYPTAVPLDVPEGSGGGFGDPHLITFDGLQYDCQGRGEFVLFRSVALLLDIHVRFVGTGFTPYSLMDSIAVREGGDGAPSVQVALSTTPTEFSNVVSGCNIAFYIDGELKDLNSGTGDEVAAMDVFVESGKIYLNCLISGIVVIVRPRWGCRLLNAFVHLPEELYSNETDIVGLLGSPNSDRLDDWMYTNGTAKPGPSSTIEALYERAYEYCTSVWCIQNADESLLAYVENQPTFAEFEYCDVPFPGRHNLATVTQDVLTFCGESITCIIDGSYGGLELAQDTKAAEEIGLANKENVGRDFTISPSQSPTEKPILLYQNDFENPLFPVPIDCGSNLHIENTINKVFGTDQLAFRQEYTVETVVINSMWNSNTPYIDLQQSGGSYSIGMFGSPDPDKLDLLALDFDTQGKAFVNVALDLSTIDVVGCGVDSFTGADAILHLMLLDSPSGEIIFSGNVLDAGDFVSPTAANAWTFNWTRSEVALNATSSTNGQVTLVFDMLSPEYAAFDNLVIEASDIPGANRL